MTAPATHIFRLLRWGRTLARHGCLRIIEEAPNTPPQVRRLCRIARLGTLQPRIPDYAGAFQAIGPAAIKLGQTLATRPDLVGEEAAHNLLSLQDSLPPVRFELIAREIERGIAPEKIFLAGFSQGGAIILTAALSRTAPLAGLIALSTYLPEADGAKRAEGAVQVPVFMAHGSSDPVIPQAVAAHSAQALQALGLEVEWHSYPMAHQVCAEEIQALGDWLQERLGAA